MDEKIKSLGIGTIGASISLIITLIIFLFGMSDYFAFGALFILLISGALIVYELLLSFTEKFISTILSTFAAAYVLWVYFLWQSLYGNL